MISGDVVVQLPATKPNERILPELKKRLRDAFPKEKVFVGLGKEYNLKLRRHGDEGEAEVKAIISDLGGKLTHG